MQFTSIATGLYLEGLAVDGETVWFTDVIPGGVQRLGENNDTKRWLPERRWIGGLLLNEDGSVLCSGPGGIAWFNPATGRSGILLSMIDGVPLLGANEMYPDGKGGIYFGTLDVPAIEKGQRPSPAALYRLDVEGRTIRLCDGLAFSNGIGVSLDGRRLFHNESFVGTFAYEIRPDGSLGERKMLLKKEDCDGMAIDAEGRLWITGFNSAELLCLAPDGSIVQRVSVPAGAVTNIRFGGNDGRDIFVTTVPADAGERLARGNLPSTPTSVLYRAHGTVAGRPVLRPRFRLA